THDIEIVIDRLVVERREQTIKRLTESIQTAMYHGEDVLMILDQDSGELRFFSRNLMCPTTGISYPNPEPNTFSFNSPKGMCPHCSGLGSVYQVNLKKVIADDTKSIKSGAILPIGPYKNTWIFKQLETIAQRFDFKLTDAVKDIPAQAMDIILNGGNEKFQVSSKTLGITRDYKIEFEGIVHFITNQYKESNSNSIQRWAKEYMDKVACEHFGGSRLKESSLHFKINQKNIAELSAMDLGDLAQFFVDLKDSLTAKQFKIAEEILKEISTRIQFLLDVGLTYLALNRSSKTLSGGEAQRIRLATQIGSQLVGVLYILDEPSIGLHQRDNNRLIRSLESLSDIGNSVIVVEHDKDMILKA